MDRRAVRIALVLIILVAALVAIGWVGFMLSENMTAWDAFAATINILSTVGLGNAPANSRASQILVVVLQIGALGIVAVAVATMSASLGARHAEAIFGRYRMDDRINKLSGHFIIVGYSLTGETLTHDLASEGQKFVVIERDPQCRKLEDRGVLFVEGDAIDETVLKNAGIEAGEGIFACFRRTRTI